MAGASGALQRSIWDEDPSWSQTGEKRRWLFRQKLVEKRSKERLEDICLGFHS